MIRTARIPTQELATDEYRLDAFYYASGGRIIEHRLRQAGIPLERLDKAALPPFIGPRFARHFVYDPMFGMPFLGPSEMRLAELANLPLLSSTRTPSIEHLQIGKGWILISRSGVIGNYCYVREDMDGLIGSDDLIRIVPRLEGAPPGYLYTFLCSDIGGAILRRSTYGAVIQHIEPHQIAGIPIPRIDKEVENAIHSEVDKAARQRVNANSLLCHARTRVYEVTGLPRHNYAPVGRNLRGTRTFRVSHSDLGERLEARFHDIFVREIQSIIQINARCGWIYLNQCADIFLPPRGKWMNVSVGGIPLIGSGEMFSSRPKASRNISTVHSPAAKDLIVHEFDILVARSGQIYSILGDAVMVGRTLAGKAVSEHAIRILAHPSTIHPGYLYAFLTLPDYGYSQIIRTAYGTSIPSLSVDDMQSIKVPLPSKSEQDATGDEVLHAINLLDTANELEDGAQEMLQKALADAIGSAHLEQN